MSNKASRFARVQFLVNHADLMASPGPAIAEALKAAGLYAPQTKLSDIAVTGLLRRARSVIAGRSYPAPDSKKPVCRSIQVELEQVKAELAELKRSLNRLEDLTGRHLYHQPLRPLPGHAV